MGIITDGRMQFAPFSAATTQTLQEIQERLVNPQETDRDTIFWSTVRDEPNQLRRAGVTDPVCARPYVIDGSDGVPERLPIRAYWWVQNKNALTIPGIDPNALYQLDSVDIVMHRASDESVKGIVSTRNPGTISRHVKTVLESLFAQDGKIPPIHIGPDANEIISEDFFLWLIYRSHSDKDISDTLFLQSVSEVTGSDARHRRSTLGDDATLDRAELLALLMGGTTKFGPVKVCVEHSSESLLATIKIHEDSGFELVYTPSRFKGEKNSAIPSGPLYRIVMLETVYFKTLPELISAYHGDADWREDGRRKFIDMAHNLLTEVLKRILAESE